MLVEALVEPFVKLLAELLVKLLVKPPDWPEIRSSWSLGPTFNLALAQKFGPLDAEVCA